MQLACNPIPAVVRARAQEVLNVIALAKEHELHSDAAAGSGGDDVSAHSVRIAEAVARQQQVARSFLPVTPVMGVIVSPTLMTPSPEIVTPSPQAGLTAEQLFSMAKWQALPESRLAEMQGLLVVNVFW